MNIQNQYTSTGVKFWRHPDQMYSYREGTGQTVISTHISPEGRCNLDCLFCSVSKRQGTRISLGVIQDYVKKLQTRGLKAAVITGGGEPTIYPQFNDLVTWLYDRGVKVGLVTNGTLSHRVDVWELFTWVRVSVNLIKKWEDRITIPVDRLSADCVVGLSTVHSPMHDEAIYRRIAQKADALNAKYVRVVPNCLVSNQKLLEQHKAIDEVLGALDDGRFFNQHKLHVAPRAGVCHQAYFRPYLSEEPWHEDGVPGTVYPCDSLVLNDAQAHFAKDYQICRATDILDFLDGKIGIGFVPRYRCNGCVYSQTVEMLDRWRRKGISRFHEFTEPIVHEEFV